jgi:hypothetical protein
VSKRVVLDVDGEEGFDTLRDLERAYSPLSRTASVRTPNGGEHFHFRHPGGEVPTSAGKIGPGIDIRGENAYVLMPPSIGANGRPYEVDEEAPLADAPRWLVELARRDGGRPRPDRQPLPDRRGDALTTIPATEYVAVLLGLTLGRDGKVVCPFHDDHAPSLHAYDEPDRGWCCYGCNRGGSIIDFGAHLYGIEPRGAGFHEIRRRLAADLMGGVS